MDVVFTDAITLVGRELVAHCCRQLALSDTLLLPLGPLEDHV